MSESTTKLTIAAGTTGTQQSAAELQKVADAQGQLSAKIDASKSFAEAARPAHEALAEAQQKLAAAQAGLAQARDTGSVAQVAEFNEQIRQQEAIINRLGGAQEELTASHRDFFAVLRTINPELGNFVQEMFHGIKVSGELASKQLDLSKIFANTITFIKDNVAALSLLGAGGAVVFGINAITSAMEKLREESKKVTDEIEAQMQAHDALANKRKTQQQSIEDISDVRPGGGLTADESQQAIDQARRIKASHPNIHEEAINQALGNYFSPGKSDEEMAKIAFDIDTKRLNPSQSNDPGGMTHFRKQFGIKTDTGAPFDIATRRETIQEARDAMAAQSGLNTQTLSTELNAVIDEELADRTDDVRKKVREKIREFGNRVGLNQAIDSAEAHGIAEPGGAYVRRPGSMFATQTEYIPPDIMSALNEVLNRVEAQAQRANITIIHQPMPNARIIGPSARYQQQAAHGAEWRRAEAERR